MINPKELRIGNLVKIDYIGEVKLKGVYRDQAVAMPYDEDHYYRKKRVTGIPITEEWLEKCEDVIMIHKSVAHGFVLPIGEGLEIVLEWLISNEWAVSLQKDWKHITYLKPLEYVHQLQNLYFALTGKELKIKEALPTDKAPFNS